MTTTISTLDLGQEIARDYWLKTPHCLARGYPDTTHCAMCGLAESTLHIEATPKLQPTVTEIVDQLPGHGSYSIKLSCGHGPLHSSAPKKNLPKVGSEHDCFDCHFAWIDQNHPGLPESIKEQIEALIPKCPKCGGQVARIPFVKHTVHTIYFDLDGQTGQLDGESDHDDTLDEYPDWKRNTFALLDDGWGTGEVEVECKDKHSWLTRSLAYRNSKGDHAWKIVRP